MSIIKIIFYECKFIAIRKVFEGFAGCVRERKRVQTTIINDTKIHSKIYENRCRIYARKSDAKMMEADVKMDPKGEPK